MDTDVRKSMEEVIHAMESISNAFEGKIEQLRQNGKDEEALQKLVKGAMAMKDAAGIYLSWAQHYIAQLEKTEGLEPNEAESIISES